MGTTDNNIGNCTKGFYFNHKNCKNIKKKICNTKNEKALDTLPSLEKRKSSAKEQSIELTFGQTPRKSSIMKYKKNIKVIMKKKLREVDRIEKNYQYSQNIMQAKVGTEIIKEWLETIQEILIEIDEFNEYSPKIRKYIMNLKSPIIMRNNQANLWTQYTQAIFPNPKICKDFPCIISTMVEEICEGIPIFQGIIDIFDEIFLNKFQKVLTVYEKDILELEIMEILESMKEDVLILYRYFNRILCILYDKVHYMFFSSDRDKIYSSVSFQIIFQGDHIYYMFIRALSMLHNTKLTTFSLQFDTNEALKINQFLGEEYFREGIIHHDDFKATLELSKNIENCVSPFSKWIYLESIGDIIKKNYYSILFNDFGFKQIEETPDLSILVYKIWLLFNYNPSFPLHLEFIQLFHEIIEPLVEGPILKSITTAYLAITCEV